MEEYDIDCPYCGESIGILIDCSLPEQQYVEDCQVCCSPILISASTDSDGQITQVRCQQENE